MGFFDFNMGSVEELDLQTRVKDYKRYGEPCSYLPLPCKKMWFRSQYPTGKITYSVIEQTDNYVTVEARVHANCADDKECYIGFAVATTFLDETRPDAFLSEEKRRFEMVAKARGLAATMALSDAGFGLQFSDTTDDPIFQEYLANKEKKNDTSDIPTAPLPPTTEPATPTVAPKKRGRKSKAEKEAELAALAFVSPHTEDLTDNTEETAVNAEKEIVEPLNASKDDSPAEEIPFEEAEYMIPATECSPTESVNPETVLADVGPYAGKPVADLAIANPSYIIWLITHSKKAEVIDAAKKVCRENTALLEKAKRQNIEL